MATGIIQHHEPFDFGAFFQTVRSKYVGLDYRDYIDFIQSEGEKHSFIGIAEWSDRVKNALDIAIASDNAGEIINRASSVMIAILRSPEAERPVTVEEVKYLSEFFSGLHEDCEVAWCLADDPSLANAIKVIMLVNIEESKC